jgi:L-alanine-DL-glutamate epimerase-like enolase superfamily enzyme
MRVTSINPFVVLNRNVFVRVRTDEGIVGWGECSPIAPRPVASLVAWLAPLVVGRDPMETGPIWQALFTGGYKLGHGGIVGHAISGIDIALWDIKGKVLGQPIHRLLGGAHRTEVELIASLWRRDLSIEAEVERVRAAVTAGYRSVKLHLDRRWGHDAQPDQTIALMTAVRRAVGDGVELLADMNNAYTLRTAIRVGRAFQELGVTHFEEPLPPYDLEGYRELQRVLHMPVATGEQDGSRWQFEALANRSRVGVLMPDVIKTYGITETMRIADVAQTANIPVVCHNAYPTINTVAHLHVWAAAKMCYRPQEYVIDPDPLRDEVPLFDQLPLPSGGRLTIPDRPGLGIEPNEAELAKLLAMDR